MKRPIAVWLETDGLLAIRADLGQHPPYAVYVDEEYARILVPLAGLDVEVARTVRDFISLMAALHVQLERINAREGN